MKNFSKWNLFISIGSCTDCCCSIFFSLYLSFLTFLIFPLTSSLRTKTLVIHKLPAFFPCLNLVSLYACIYLSFYSHFFIVFIVSDCVSINEWENSLNLVAPNHTNCLKTLSKRTFVCISNRKAEAQLKIDRDIVRFGFGFWWKPSVEGMNCFMPKKERTVESTPK